MSEVWNSILFRQNPLPMFIYSSDTLDILDVNESAVLKYGYTMDELREMKVKDIRVEEDLETLMSSLPKRKQGFDETEIVRHRKKDGNLMYVRVTSQPIRYKNQNALISSIFDVTEIQKNNEKLNFHFSNSQLGWIEWDNELSITKWSHRAEEILGWTKEETLGKKPSDFILFSQLDYDTLQNELRELYIHNKPRSTFELRVYHKSGKIIHTVWHNSVMLDSNGKWISVLSQVQDVTDQKQTEEQLKLLTTAVESADNGIVITDIEGKIIWVNPAFTRLTGYRFDEVQGENPRIMKSGMQDQNYYTNLWRTIKAGQVWNGVLINRRKDGTTYIEEETITPVYSDNHVITHFIAIKRDVTDRENKEEHIRKSLQEKETLLAEIHHRVKNNLAIISSLLELQAFNAPNEHTEQILHDSQLRIKTIALIHEKLYHFEQLSEIEFGHYISDLVDTISGTVFTDKKKINTSLDLESVQLNIKQAIPAALILNELITNTFKHAFKNGRTGRVKIKLFMTPEEKVVIKVHDNGIGLPEHFDITQSQSMGMTIIQRLCRQLNANINIETDAGTCFTVSFEKPRDQKEITGVVS